MLKPLPCPFCGHDADHARLMIGYGGNYRYAIGCGQPDGCVVEAQATAGTVEDAIRLWNTRAAAHQTAKVAA